MDTTCVQHSSIDSSSEPFSGPNTYAADSGCSNRVAVPLRPAPQASLRTHQQLGISHRCSPARSAGAARALRILPSSVPPSLDSSPPSVEPSCGTGLGLFTPFAVPLHRTVGGFRFSPSARSRCLPQIGLASPRAATGQFPALDLSSVDRGVRRPERPIPLASLRPRPISFWAIATPARSISPPGDSIPATRLPRRNVGAPSGLLRAGDRAKSPKSRRSDDEAAKRSTGANERWGKESTHTF